MVQTYNYTLFVDGLPSTILQALLLLFGPRMLVSFVASSIFPSSELIGLSPCPISDCGASEGMLGAFQDKYIFTFMHRCSNMGVLIFTGRVVITILLINEIKYIINHFVLLFFGGGGIPVICTTIYS